MNGFTKFNHFMIQFLILRFWKGLLLILIVRTHFQRRWHLMNTNYLKMYRKSLYMDECLYHRIYRYIYWNSFWAIKFISRTLAKGIKISTKIKVLDITVELKCNFIFCPLFQRTHSVMISLIMFKNNMDSR